MPSITVNSRAAANLASEIEWLVDAVLYNLELNDVFEDAEIKSYVQYEGPLAFWTREELLDILDIEEA